MDPSLWKMALLSLLFFAVATLYSRAGLGGGSSYLALLALFGWAIQQIPATALFLNLLVSSQGWRQFAKAGHFELRLLAPFLITSLPASYIGGRWRIDDRTLGLIFAAGLLLVGIRFIVWRETWSGRIHVKPSALLWIAPPIGLGLGLLAGMIGIGGGIFLGPLLILMGWASPKQAAASSAAFIVMNSATGLIAKLGWQSEKSLDWRILIPLALSVALGGWLGSREGAWKISAHVLQRTLGIILVLAGIHFTFSNT